jgi:hypothetical protein
MLRNLISTAELQTIWRDSSLLKDHRIQNEAVSSDPSSVNY